MSFKDKTKKTVSDVKTYCKNNPKEAKNIAAGVAMLAIEGFFTFAFGKKLGRKEGFREGYTEHNRDKYNWTVTSPSGKSVPAYELLDKAFDALSDK